MKTNYLLFTSYFLLFTFSYALPFQEPVAGSYPCFVVGDDPFNVNTQDAGQVDSIWLDGTVYWQ